MAKYSKDFKLNIIKQMLPPENKKVIQISKETGIAEHLTYIEVVSLCLLFLNGLVTQILRLH